MVLYVGLMIHLGRRSQRQVASADDFAVARGAYGPLTLAIAYAATAASGATFLGLPGLAYQYGMGILWVGLLCWCRWVQSPCRHRICSRCSTHRGNCPSLGTENRRLRRRQAGFRFTAGLDFRNAAAVVEQCNLAIALGG